MASAMDTVSIPLSLALGQVPALDAYQGSVRVVEKGVKITQQCIDSLGRAAEQFPVVVRRNPSLERMLRQGQGRLRGTGVLRQLDARACAELNETFPPEYTLFREGDRSKEIYILRQGKVAVIKGDEMIAEIDQAGTFLGEMSCLLDQPRTATIRTLDESVFTVVPGEQLLETAMQHPGILVKLCQGLAAKVANTTDDLVTLQTYIVLERD